jgi:hypothetical protein
MTATKSGSLHYVILALIFTLSACGGGGGSDETANSQPPNTVGPEEPVSDESGDSNQEAIVYQVDVASTPKEGGVVTGSGEYEKDTEASLTATPNEEYFFSGWIIDGQTVSTERSYKYQVESNTSIIASFKYAAPTVQPTAIRYDQWPGSKTVSVDAADPQGKPLALKIVEEPQEGTVSVDNLTFQLTYTPRSAGFFKDHFKISVSNDSYESEPQVVTVGFLDTDSNNIPDFVDPVFNTATEIGGILDGNLTLNDGPYLITSNLQVRGGLSLTVGPGVTLLLKNDVMLTIGGTLKVLGNANNLTRFMAAEIDPVGWSGIDFLDGHEGTTIVNGEYESGMLMRGTSISGLSGNLGMRFKSRESRDYLIEDSVFLGTTVGLGNVDFFSKNPRLSQKPNVHLKQSVIHTGDKEISSELPSRLANRANITIANSIIRGEYSTRVITTGVDEKVLIENSTFNLRPSSTFSGLGLEVPYSKDTPLIIKNSVITGGVLFNRAFDQSRYPIAPTLEYNIFKQGSAELLFRTTGSNTPDDTFALGPNYYPELGAVDPVVYDGNDDIEIPFLDLSSRLSEEPAAGPKSESFPVLKILTRELESSFRPNRSVQ